MIKSLPACEGFNWRGFHADGRLVILNIPYDLLASIQDVSKENLCKPATVTYEDSVRSFVNILMVALATDYKKDQIHLPEILKRLR